MTAIGVSDQEGRFRVLKVQEAEGKDGQSIANEMLETLEDFDAKKKINFIQSDSAAGTKMYIFRQVT